MNESSATPSPDEEVLAAFVADLEGAADQARVVASYCERHPTLAQRFQQTVIAELVQKRARAA